MCVCASGWLFFSQVIGACATCNCQLDIREGRQIGQDQGLAFKRSHAVCVLSCESSLCAGDGQACSLCGAQAWGGAETKGLGAMHCD